MKRKKHERMFFSGIEYLTLLTIQALGSKAHFSSILRQICKSSNEEIDVSTVYKVLARFKERGILKLRKKKPEPEHKNLGRPPKSYYKITEDGKDKLLKFDLTASELKYMAFENSCKELFLSEVEIERIK